MPISWPLHKFRLSLKSARPSSIKVSSAVSGGTGIRSGGISSRVSDPTFRGLAMVAAGNLAVECQIVVQNAVVSLCQFVNY